MATNLLVTLGFGSSDDPLLFSSLPTTMGLGFSTLLPFGIGIFRLDSVQLLASVVLRVRYTADPQESGADSTRPAFAGNYTLTRLGGGAPAILTASTASDDDEVVDLHLAGPLPAGTYTLTVAHTILAEGNVPLSGPDTVVFEVRAVVPGPLSGGAEELTAEDELLRLLHPAYRRKTVWRAVVGGLATAFDAVRRQGRAVFDQLFIASASGKYLVSRAADVGVPKAVDVGMTDGLFRQLALGAMSHKLTQRAFLMVLEVFYGRAAVSAYADSAPEPFVLDDGSTLEFLVDELVPAELVVRRAEYEVMRRATADEVCAALNRAFASAADPPPAEAVPVTDPDTGGRRVRVYSKSRGLASSLRVTGGAAAPAMGFPQDLFPLTDSDPLPAWSVAPQADGTELLSADSDASYDLSKVEVGDFVVVSGAEFSEANRGWWRVDEVHYAYPAGVLDQWVRVSNPAASSQTAATQLRFGSVKFYRPQRRTTYGAPGWVAVSQRDGYARVSIPATSTAVRRQALGAAYLQPPIVLAGTVVSTTEAVTVTTATPHGIAPGDVVELAGFRESAAVPPVDNGTPSGALGSDSSAQGSSGRNPVTAWHTDTTIAASYGVGAATSKGEAWVVGGDLLDGLGGDFLSDKVSVTVPVAKPVVAGAPAFDYKWFSSTVSEVASGTAAAALQHPDDSGDVAVAGGYPTTAWDDLTSAIVRKSFRQLRRIVPGFEVLVDHQLSSAGVLAALGFQLNNQPPTGALLSVADASGTRTYGFGSGGSVTVAIGVDAATTAANLATALTGDGSARWSGQVAADRIELGAHGTVAIHERSVVASRATLRIWGSSNLAAVATVTPYATATSVATSYAGGVPAPLPTSDPGYGTAGPHRGGPSLQTSEIRKVIAADPGGGYLADNYWQWTGSAWSDTVSWFRSLSPSALLSVFGAVDATIGALPGQVCVFGGVAINAAGSAPLLNQPWNFAQKSTDSGTGSFAFSIVSMRAARAQPGVVAANSTSWLIVGGRAPFTPTSRTNAAFDTWSFNESFAAANYASSLAGLPTIPVGTNRRVPGKWGYGVLLSSSMTAAAGSAQTTLNAALKPGGGAAYTVMGWMTAGQGCVVKNGATSWAAAADNTLLEFGVDPADDKFYVSWDTGTSGIRAPVTMKTSFTATSIWGTPPPPTPPRYHFVALVNTAGGAGRNIALYVNGKLRGTLTAAAPASGANARWAFGSSGFVSASPFQGAVDEFGFVAAGLSAETIQAIYWDEVGVLRDASTSLDLMPVGKVRASCETRNSSGTTGSTGDMGFARAHHQLVKLPDGRVLAAGGVGYPASDPPAELSQRGLELRSAEVWDPASGLWTRIPDMCYPHSWGAAGVVGNRVYVAGGFASPPLEYLDLDTMEWHVSTAGAGPAAGSSGAVVGGLVVATQGSTLASGVPTTQRRDFTAAVAAETVASGRLNTVQAALPGTTGSTLILAPTGSAGSAAGGEVRPARAGAGLPGMPGPFVFDPTSGVGLSSVRGTLAAELQAGRQYPEIVLAAGADGFPDEPGWLCFNIGRADFVGPVRYLGRVGEDGLATDAGYKLPHTVAAGGEVTLLATRTPFVPENPETVGAAYLTDSPAGRAAATDMLRRISAGGIDLKLEVRYPGDRGLGGEGRPTRGAQKLSDVVPAFAHDVDAEEAAARLGEEVL